MKRFAAVILSFSLFTFLTVICCTVGLGEAVDTQNPEVSISYPETGSRIRGEFVVKGTGSDETALESVTLIFTNLSSKKLYTFDADIQKERGTWSCVINKPKCDEGGNFILDDFGNYTYDLLDGSYKLEAVAKDKAGRETAYASSYVIDNTAPVLVLNRPASKFVDDQISQNSIDAFGQELIISGSAADDGSLIKKIEIQVFPPVLEEPENPLATFTLVDVDMAFSEKVAVYGAENHYYESIYDSTKQGTQNFSYKIRVYDDAHIYDGKTDPLTTVGNVRDFYYIKNENFAKNVLNSCTVADLYSILNGTYKVAKNRSPSYEEIVTRIVSDDYCVSKGIFSLNPNNNPTYAVYGGKQATGENCTTDNQKALFFANNNAILTGNELTVKMSVGLDGDLLVKDSLGIYLVPFKYENDVYTLDDEVSNRIWLVKPLVVKEGTPSFDEETWIAKTQEELEARESLRAIGDTYMCSRKMQIEDGLEVGTVYAVGAVGYDIGDNQNSFKVDYVDGFVLASANALLKLNIKTDSQLYCVKDSEISIDGEITTDAKATVSLKVYKATESVEDDEAGVVVENAEWTTPRNSSDGEAWPSLIVETKTLKDSEGNLVFDPSTSDYYIVKVVAKAGETNTTYKTINVFYDLEAPVLEIFEITPYVDYLYDEELSPIVTVNGLVNLKIRATDNDKVFSAVASDDDSKDPSVVIKNSYGEDCLISVKASDIVSTFSEILDTASGNFIHYDARNDGKEITTATVNVVFFDRAGNRSEATKQFYIDQSTKNPIITPLDTVISYEEENINYRFDGDLWPAGAKQNYIEAGNPVTFELKDDKGLKTVTTTLLNSAGEEIHSSAVEIMKAGTSNKVKTREITYTIPKKIGDVDISGGVYKLKVEATDTDLNTTTLGPYWIKVTNGLPVVETYLWQNGALSQKIENSNLVTLTKNYDLKIQVSDSDVEAVDVSVSIKNGNEVLVQKPADYDEENPVPYDYQVIKIDSSNYRVEINNNPDGVFEYNISAIRGNDITSERVVIRNIMLDKTPPVISNKAIVYSTASRGMHNSGDFYSDTKPLLGVNTTDETSGINAVYCYISSEVLYKDSNANHRQIDLGMFESALVKQTEGDYRYTRTLSVGEGVSYVYLLVEDEAGNTTLAGLGGTFVVKCDTTKPEIAFVVPENNSILSKNVPCDFNISVTDSVSGIQVDSANLFLKATSSDSDENAIYTINSISQDEDGNFVGTIPQSEMAKFTTDNGVIKFVVQDCAGNENINTLSFTLDTENPKVEFLNPVANKVNGKISITGKASDNIKLQKVDLYRTVLAGDSEEDVVQKNIDGEQNPVSLILLKTFEDQDAVYWAYSKNGSDVIDVSGYDGNTITFYAIATDKAKNISTAKKAIEVDQDTDRPILRFSNVIFTNEMSENSPIWITKEQIYGTVQDDDGIESVKIAFTLSQNEEDWEEIYDVDGGNWVYNFPSDGSKDGFNTIYFKVKDTGRDAPFISSVRNAKDLNAPKLNYKEVTFGSSENMYTTVMYAKVDLVDPTIPVAYYSTEDYSSITNETISGLIGSNEQIASSYVDDWQELSKLTTGNLGGDTKSIYVLAKAKDSNGIKDIQLTFGGETAHRQKVAYKSVDNVGNLLVLYKIDISAYEEQAKKNIEIKAIDNADRYRTLKQEVSIDNIAPVITLITPNSDGVTWYGTAAQNITGQTTDYTGVKEFYFGVSKNAETAPTNWSSDLAELGLSTAMWQITFDGSGSNTTVTQYYADLLNTYVDSLYGVNYHTTHDNVPLCIWFYAVDTLGNSGLVNQNFYKRSISVLTQGDKPTVSITYPSTGAIVGGAITITGTTTISTSSVSRVHLEITGDNGKSESRDADGSVQSWYVIINNDGKFVKYNSDGTKANTNVHVEVFAESETGKQSEIVELDFVIDPNSPVFGDNEPISLVQYENNENGTGEIVARQLYQNQMWVKGIWWIVGSVSDESGIGSVEFDRYVDSEHAVSVSPEPHKLIPLSQAPAAGGDYVLLSDSNNTKSYCKLHIKVGSIESENSGMLYYKLLAYELDSSTGLTQTQFIDLSYDNKAPDFSVTSLNKTESNQIVQSNGAYEISGTYLDAGTQSGFERIAFYVKRTYKGSQYITDLMVEQGNEITDNSYLISSLENETSETGMYWHEKECSIQNNYEVVLPDGTVPASIRAGSLCRINKVIYRIKKVEGRIVTLENKVTNTKDDETTPVQFAVAQVIDVKLREVGKTTYFGDLSNTIINDDGDQMVESFQESSGEWFASINSKNILDGVVELCFVAYDKAGNMTDIQDYTFDCKVANNAPRIAGIKFGTDRNGSGQVENQELISSYSGLYAHGQTSQGRVAKFAVPCDLEGDTSVIQGNSVLTIKGETKIVPEIVGGNESLGWSYDVGTNQAAVQNAALPGSSGVTQFEGAGHAYDENVRDTEITTINLSIKDLLNKKDIADSSLSDGEKVFRFIIWDYTEGTKIGTESSNHAEIYLKANLAISDSVAPVTGINPFYWNQAGEGNSSVMFDNKVPLGHIELEKDLSFTGSPFKASNEGVSGKEIFDLDPKVSGVIYLEGFARDNVNISKVYIKIPGLEGFDDYVPFIQRQSNGTWTCPYSLETDGIALAQEVQDITDEDEYNVVSWKIAFDTSKLTGGVKADLVVKVKAEDFGKAVLDENNPKGFSYQNPMSSEDSDVQTTKETKTCRYKMDVVPYIHKVTTRLSSLKSNNPSVYSRTARGHYSISAEETEVVLSGFNLSSTGEKTMTLDASAIASSGDWELVLADTEDITVKSLNNYNNNDAKGDYSGTVDLSNNPTGDYDTYKNYYNRSPNGDNNNLLTDDVTLDIWQVNSQAGKPTNGPLTQPVMAINPVNKQVGFAFVNGPLYFSMGGTNTSYQLWKYGIDFWTSVGFAYDSNGNSYGTTAGGDINSTPAADSYGIYSSKWGTGTIYNNNGTLKKDQEEHNKPTGCLRLELIGQGEADNDAGTSFDGSNINKQRIKSTSIATTVVDATNTNVYLAYYDEINNEIRFKYGNFSTTKANNGLFADYYGPNSSLRNTKTVKDLPYTLEYTSLIAGQTTGKKTFYIDSNGATQYYTANTAVTTSTGKAVCAGQYVSIAAKYQGGDIYNTGTEESPVMFTDDLVVAVWYDATNNQMLYSYNTAPHKIKALTYKGTDRTIDSYSQSATGWSTPVAIFGEGNGIGEYCKVAMDANGKVHVACYDNSNGDVWYAYIDDYSAPSSARTCIVDSYGIVGTEIGLDVAIKDGNPVPYISYYGSSCARPKVAYWAGTESIASATSLYGALYEVSSGLWEISLVPTKSKISIDHINVGVWKNSSGVLNYSTLNGEAPNGITPGQANANVGVCNAGTDNGMVYGNGTMNPILGYAITQGAGGFIETAQIK